MTHKQSNLVIRAVMGILVDETELELNKETLEKVCCHLNNYLGYHGEASFTVRTENPCDCCLPFSEIVITTEDNK